MAFHGIKINEDGEIVKILRRPEQTVNDTVCFSCGREISPITSYKATITTGKAPKWIPDPQKRRDPAGNVIEMLIYIPITVNARMCRECVGNLQADQYLGKSGQTVGVFRDSEDRLVRIHFENETGATVHGSSKTDRKPEKPENERIVREYRLSKDETIFIETADPAPAGVYQDRDGNITGAIPDKPDANSFGKFGFKRPKDYRKYLRG